MTARISIGLVGIGKIARDQHLPALNHSDAFALAATASRNASLEDIPAFTSLRQMIDGVAPLSAVSLCTPPQGRHALAAMAIDAGLHVMIEKPPAATVGELQELAARAARRKVALFATWHSREAAAVEAARAWLENRTVRRMRIVWKEDVRVWHPGQEWIWHPGGFGVFDPGINALSIVTRLFPDCLVVESADLSFPSNRSAPIKAQLALRHRDALCIEADFDFLQTGPQTWNIEIATETGNLVLSMGGATMHVDGVQQQVPAGNEYERLYARFAQLIASRSVDADAAPLQLVADAFLCGSRTQVEAFNY